MSVAACVPASPQPLRRRPRGRAAGARADSADGGHRAANDGLSDAGTHAARTYGASPIDPLASRPDAPAFPARSIVAGAHDRNPCSRPDRRARLGAWLRRRAARRPLRPAGRRDGDRHRRSGQRRRYHVVRYLAPLRQRAIRIARRRRAAATTARRGGAVDQGRPRHGSAPATGSAARGRRLAGLRRRRPAPRILRLPTTARCAPSSSRCCAWASIASTCC